VTAGPEAFLASVLEVLRAARRVLGGRIGDDLAAYLVQSGKMLRARFTGAIGEALGAPQAQVRTIALVAELVHNASLLHDDCIDSAALRRGRPTANAAFGPKVAIMLGDLAVTQALRVAHSLPPLAQQTLLDAISDMVLGEVMEERRLKDVSLTESEYLGIVRLKNGALFQWCARAAAHATGAGRWEQAGGMIGQLVGTAHQLVDDVLDLEQGAERTGKEGLQDLRRGVLTLPLLRALAQDNPAFPIRRALRDAWERPQGQAPKRLARMLVERGFMTQARREAAAAVQQARRLARDLPGPPAALESFLSSLVERTA